MSSRDVLHRIGSELRDNPPRVLEKTRKKKGRKQVEKQRRAILISKARRAGARV
jgi:hypothetical protein